MNRSENPKGYSLTDLLLALAILGILLAIAVPNLMKYSRWALLEGAGRTVLADLYRARRQAANSNSRYRIYFDVPGNRYYFQVDANNNRRISTSEEHRQYHYLPGGIRFDCQGVKGPPSRPKKIPGGPVTFRHGLMSVGPDGFWSNPGTIYLGNSDEEHVAISVNIAGTARLWCWEKEHAKWRPI